jgi:diguanylate cyclase (GGDEF)-like protein
MDKDYSPRLDSAFKAYAEYTAITVLVIGIVVLAGGWVCGISFLQSLHPNWVSMKANTAIAFLLIGMSLFLLQIKLIGAWLRYIYMGCAMLVTLIGAITLVEYIFGVDIRIDQLFFNDTTPSVGTVSPGRMAPSTAMCFFLIGVALFLLDMNIQGYYHPSQYLALIAGLPAMLCFIGYLYGVESLMGFHEYTRMALHTVIVFVLSCLSLLLTYPHRGFMGIITSRYSGGAMSRRLFPLIIFIIILLGGLMWKGQRAGLYDTEFGLSMATVISIVVFTIIIWFLARSLNRKDIKSEEAHLRLAEYSNELGQHNREIMALAKMAKHLQSSSNSGEVYAVVSAYIQKLFPDNAGVIFVFDASKKLLEAVVKWGEPVHDQSVFVSDDCWALRLGKEHDVYKPEARLPCAHFKQPPSFDYMCVPMMSHEVVFGVLHLQLKPHETGAKSVEMDDHQQQLAVAVAEHVAQSLMNVSLLERLREQSIRDPLTGLFNRRYLEETLEREIRRAIRNQKPIGLIMLDIDNFKRFNDTYGHEAGDVLLQNMGGFMKLYRRGSDVACRYGGEEFILVLPEASLDNTRKRAEELCSGIKELQVSYNGKLLGKITLSMGIAIFPEHGAESAELIRAADKALYKAKQSGRDRVVAVDDQVV